MKLIEESYHIWDSNEIEIPVLKKLYNKDGNLIWLSEIKYDESYGTSFIYNKTGQLEEELISINRSYGTPGEELKKQYVYNNSGYSILTTQLREIHDSCTSEKFKGGGLISVEDYTSKHPIETNRLVHAEEYYLNKSGLILSAKHHNLICNTIELQEYEYQDNFESIIYYSLVSNIKKQERKLIREFDESKRLILEREIDYSNDKETIVKCTEYKYWQTDDFNKTKYKTIKTDDGLEKNEKYDDFGNLLQETNNYGDRTIFINEYNEANLLASAIGIYIRDDYHKLSSKRLLKYN